MEGQFFLTTIAGLAFSLAGFAGIIAALRGDLHMWSPIDLWRVKTIVRVAFATATMALALIPVFDLTNDLRATVRVGAALLVIHELANIRRDWSREPSIWPSDVGHKIVLAIFAGVGITQVVNLWFASLGLFEIALGLVLMFPASIFINFVTELGPSAKLEE
jgi:hypothetical protein